MGLIMSEFQDRCRLTVAAIHLIAIEQH